MSGVGNKILGDQKFSLTRVISRNLWTLSLAHLDHPSHESHMDARDINFYTAEEIENHITLLDSYTLSRWTGDTNPAHSPASPLTLPMPQLQTIEDASN